VSTIPEQFGPYRIGRKLGRGGMGAVYAAVHVETHEPAAVKVLAPIFGDDEVFRHRFAGEIETLKKLRHPNIVQLYGFGEQAGQLFYAMELVEGSSLQDELQNGRRFDWREVARLAVGVCRALKHAHDSGVIHRDIKPANLLIDRDDRVKLSDFGIAKLFGGTQLTADGGVMGTADYMAPEQAEGRPVNHRCDLYSLGCVMYALLAGQTPFRGTSLPEVIHKLRFTDPVPLRALAADIPAELERIVGQLMTKDPAERIPTAVAIANRLESLQKAMAMPREDASAGAEDRRDLPLPPSLKRRDGNGGRFASRPTPNVLPKTLMDQRESSLSAEPPEKAKSAAGPAPGIHERNTPPAVSRDELEAIGPEARSAAAMPPRDRASARDAAEIEIGSGSAVSRRPADAPSEDHFTTLDEALRLARERAYDNPEHGPLWTKVAMGAVVALMVVVFGWYALRPPSADSLYERITEQAAGGDPAILSEVEGSVRGFLALYPDDPRRAEVEQYLEDIELYRLERRLERAARRSTDGEDFSPIEVAYLEAMRRAATEPGAAIERLRALLGVYGGDPDATAETRQCLALARRQIDRLADIAERRVKAELALLARRMEHAASVRAEDLQAAEGIWRGVIELYGDKPWAAEIVAQARRELEAEPTTP
jgi:serine/threonine protein kinase